MDSYYDARCPANGKRTPFVTCGADRVTGLSAGQTRAKRTTNWTTPEHLKGGAFMGGAPVRASTVKRTRAAWGAERTPGRKLPSQKIKPKRNPVCRNPVPTVYMRERVADEDAARIERNALKRITVQHAGYLGAGLDGDEGRYELARQKFLARFPHMAGKLDAAERENHNHVVLGHRDPRKEQNQTASDRRAIVGQVRAAVVPVVEARKAAERRPGPTPAPMATSRCEGPTYNVVKPAADGPTFAEYIAALDRKFMAMGVE